MFYGYVTFDTNLLLQGLFCCMPYMSVVVCMNLFVQDTTVVQQTNQRICSSSSSFNVCLNLCSVVVKEMVDNFLV